MVIIEAGESSLLKTLKVSLRRLEVDNAKSFLFI